jgi:DNA-binding beta-propeller fold protein YncE
VEERRYLAASRGCDCARILGVATLLGCVVVVLLWSGFAVSSAWADYELVGRFPRVPEDEPFGAMSLSEASTGVASDDTTGEVYIADGAHARVERLNVEGGFLGAWGWNVIATGPGKAGTSLEEVVRIKRTSGGENVVYKGEGSKTEPLGYEAEATTVENELANPSFKIGSETEGPVKGEIKVAKIGPGEYRFTYGGALGGELSGPVNIEKAGLEGTIETEVKQGAPAFEDCVVANGDICRKPTSFGTRGGGSGEFWLPRSVAVDQANGDVYVLDPSEHLKNAVQVFEADGKPTGTEFGESTAEKLGKVTETEKNPEKLRSASSIAADVEGNAYIVNVGSSQKEESRISVFDSTGKYVGAIARVCSAVAIKGCGLGGVAVDSTGNVYTVGEEDEVYEFHPGSKPEPDSPPVCELPPPYIPNLGALAVDGIGEVVVYSNVSHKFYWFAACEKERFKEESKRDFESKVAPPASGTTALAWNPTAKYLPAKLKYIRAEGAFYSINPAFKNPEAELNTGLIFAQPEEPEAVTKPPSPKIAEESVSDVGLSYATLNARMERYSDPIYYSFKYWTDGPNDLECTQIHECEMPDGGAKLGAGGEVVSATVSHLAPGATYHFYVVGYSFCNPKDEEERCLLEDGVGVEPEQEFTTFSADSAGLPDGRVYELVSPPFKDGGEVFSLAPNSIDCRECLPGSGDEKFPMESTADGEEVVYEGYPFSVSGGAVNENQYLAARTSEGWVTRDLSPATAVRDGSLAGYKAFSPNLSSGVFVQTGTPLSPDAPANYPNVYQQSVSVPGDVVRPLWTREDAESDPPHRGSEGTEANELKFIVGGMAEGHIIFAANDALTSATSTAPGAVDGGAGAYNLYEWMEGKLRLVNVLPGDESTQPGAAFGSGTEFPTSAGDPDYAHAISINGSRIFWTDSESHHVYVRINGKETVEIPDAGHFLVASANGSKVMLNDGHIYDLEAENIVDLTNEKGGFEGILGASENLSSVYFTDTKKLPGAAPNAYGSGAVEGGNNLYLWQEGAPTAKYIATLGEEDDNNGRAMNITTTETGDWVASPSDRTAQVTPDGRYLAFMSEAHLTGYDNLPASGTCGLGRTMCAEVFEYDAGTNHLVCVSCNPTKERPLGGSTLSLIEPGSGFMAQPLDLLADGRVFFNSADALSPEAQHAGGVENVYEYESDGLLDPDGLVSCRQVDGCIFMISSGAGETESSFVNATPSGSDVFFTTRSRLVSEDQDDLVDLYDAREGGGFAHKVRPSTCAESESCQGPPLSSPPAVESPLSATVGTKLPGVVGNVITLRHSTPRPQLLAKALHACRVRFKVHHAKRIACEKSARRRYGSPVSEKHGGKPKGKR